MSHEAEENESAIPFGVCLKEARVSLGLSLDELSKTLNLDIAILEALEKSDVDGLPPAIYVQGYIKAYTKALGISSEAIHADYLRTVNKEKNIELRPRSTLPLETNSETPIVMTFSVLLGVLALSAALFGVYNYYSGKVKTIDQTTVMDDGSEKMIIPQQRQTTVITQDARITDDGELIVSEPEVLEVTEVPEVLEGEVIEDNADEGSVKPVEKETDVDVVQNEDSLMMRAINNSWVEIRDDNQVRIYYGMLEADDMVELKGKAPFDVFLGNALNVNIAVNDIDVDMSDYIRPNSVAHFKVSEKSNQIVFH